MSVDNFILLTKLRTLAFSEVMKAETEEQKLIATNVHKLVVEVIEKDIFEAKENILEMLKKYK